MNTISLNTIFLDDAKGVGGAKKSTADSWVGSKKDLALLYSDAKLWESCSYYSSIETAIADIKKGNIASNCDEQDAAVAVDKGRLFRLFLMKDIETSSEVSLEGIELILNGHKLNLSTPISATGNCIIDGRANKSTIIGKTILNVNSGQCKVYGGIYKMNTSKQGQDGNPHPCFNIIGGTLDLEGATFIAIDDNGGTISNILVNSGSQLAAKNCSFKLTSKYGMQSCCIYNKGTVTLEKCKLEAFSDHTANSAGTNYERTARAIFGDTDSVTNLLMCYAYGAHSGMTFKGEVSVDGGTYCGYSHGGIYLSNQNKTTKIKNATFKDVPLPSGYYDDGVAGTNGAAIYIGGTTGMNVYFDNCTFYAEIQTLVMKTGGNTMYVSNCRMRHGYSRCGIRNDSSNQVKFGINNNFDYTNLENKRNYEVTDLDYGLI